MTHEVDILRRKTQGGDHKVVMRRTDNQQWKAEDSSMEFAVHPGSRDLGPSFARCYQCNLGHATTWSLVLFMNKREIINHSGLSHQVDVKTLHYNECQSAL